MKLQLLRGPRYGVLVMIEIDKLNLIAGRRIYRLNGVCCGVARVQWCGPGGGRHAARWCVSILFDFPLSLSRLFDFPLSPDCSISLSLPIVRFVSAFVSLCVAVCRCMCLSVWCMCKLRARPFGHLLAGWWLMVKKFDNTPAPNVCVFLSVCVLSNCYSVNKIAASRLDKSSMGQKLHSLLLWLLLFDMDIIIIASCFLCGEVRIVAMMF